MTEIVVEMPQPVQNVLVVDIPTEPSVAVSLVSTVTDDATVTAEILEPETLTIDVVEIGPRGEAGSEATPYLHEQTVESDEWVVNHNKGRHVAVVVKDVGGADSTAEVRHPSLNQARVLVKTPRRGYALVY